MRVRRGLDDLDIAYGTIHIPRLRRRRTAVYQASGQSRVPVLVDRANGIEGVSEGADIVAYLYEAYGSEEHSPQRGVIDRLIARLL